MKRHDNYPEIDKYITGEVGYESEGDYKWAVQNGKHPLTAGELTDLYKFEQDQLESGTNELPTDWVIDGKTLKDEESRDPYSGVRKEI